MKGAVKKKLLPQAGRNAISLQPAPLLIDDATLPRRVWLLSCCSPILLAGEEPSAENAV